MALLFGFDGVFPGYWSALLALVFQHNGIVYIGLTLTINVIF